MPKRPASAQPPVFKSQIEGVGLGPVRGHEALGGVDDAVVGPADAEVVPDAEALGVKEAPGPR